MPEMCVLKLYLKFEKTVIEMCVSKLYLKFEKTVIGMCVSKLYLKFEKTALEMCVLKLYLKCDKLIRNTSKKLKKKVRIVYRYHPFCVMGQIHFVNDICVDFVGQVGIGI